MTAAIRLDVLRPMTRGDCADGPRPCPWTSCRHHLLVEGALVGRDKLTRSPTWAPGLRVHPAARTAPTLTEALERLPETCALDVADRNPDGVALEGLGQVLGVTRERARQIGAATLAKLARAAEVRRLARG